ncbi:MAG TPA: type IV toxin-antitoxin system AbiEi family antitoxin domain-containing protein [Ilumatobacteraceae bacterium]|nr:type IV toxin-antitoxin system AbiEi family antitoxin domain-containing protein [Ilumatobacteraceae bacterium]
MDLGLLDAWARSHHGILTKRRAIDLGWTDAAWYRAIRRGQLQLMHPGVARLHGTPTTPTQRIYAALLAAGKTAVASHRSAAVLWAIERPEDDPVDVIVSRGVTGMALTGVNIHRPRDRVDMATVVRSHTPSTNLLRTLIDLGAVTGDVGAAVTSAITSGAVTPTVLEYLLARHARRGRNGTTALRHALSAWPLHGKPADSELELRMAKLLADHDLPPATFHARLAGFEVDFRIDGTPVVLECDGWDHHGRTREQFERDRERDVILGAAGYVVFHFTWRQITRRAAWTAARIRQLVERWSAPVPDRSGWPIVATAERIGHPERPERPARLGRIGRHGR